MSDSPAPWDRPRGTSFSGCAATRVVERVAPTWAPGSGGGRGPGRTAATQAERGRRRGRETRARVRERRGKRRGGVRAAADASLGQAAAPARKADCGELPLWPSPKGAAGVWSACATHGSGPRCDWWGAD
eukprot:scaffold2033_cov367-Prasinococcus_capsulatus_cf.AAC.20